MKRKTIEYHGIRSSDPGGRDGLPNPERGWRLETLVAEPAGAIPDLGVHGYAHHLEGRIFPGFNDHWWFLDAQRYQALGLTVVQSYCYLNDYVGKPLSDKKLACLQLSLDRLRRRGLKSLLRFAYEKDGARRRGPALKDILRHLDQLAPLIRANSDIIYVMQAGFVGAFGEWHSSTHGIEKDHGQLAAVMDKILEVLPADRMTQVRVPKYKRWALRQPVLGKCPEITARTAHTAFPCARIGFHNDGFLATRTCGWTWPEPPYYSNPGNPEFDYMTRECPYVPVDGELYWRDDRGNVDGLRAIVRMRLHHYGTFSLWHSYSGRVGQPYSIDEWMRDPVTPAFVREHRLPMADGYFQDAVGDEGPRSQFEYITDHLGYRFELRRAVFPTAMRPNESLRIDLELVNRGFGVPHNPRPVLFVLIDAGQRVHEISVPNADPRTWQPFQPGDASSEPLVHRIAVRTALPETVKPGWYQLGLWLPDASRRLRLDPRYAVRAANRDVPWWCDDNGRHGINILGVIQVTLAQTGKRDPA